MNSPQTQSGPTHAEIALLATLVVGGIEDGRVDASSLGTLQRADGRPVRGDAGDREACIDEGLQIRALARDEHADHAASMCPITSRPAGSGTTAQ